FQTDIRPWQQQFFAATGVFDMDGFFFAVQQDLGDKSVGAGEKSGVQDGFVVHTVFSLCVKSNGLLLYSGSPVSADSPTSKELIKRFIDLRAMRMARTESSASLICSFSFFFSAASATSAFSRSSTTDFSMLSILFTYCSYTLVEYAKSFSPLRKISSTETISLADCRIVFFLPARLRAVIPPPTALPAPSPSTA